MIISIFALFFLEQPQVISHLPSRESAWASKTITITDYYHLGAPQSIPEIVNSDEKLVSSPLIPACPQDGVGFWFGCPLCMFLFTYMLCLVYYPNMISQCTVRLGIIFVPQIFKDNWSGGFWLLAHQPTVAAENSMQGYGHEEVGKTFFMNLGWSPMFWVEVQCSGLKSNDCAHEKIDAAFVWLLYEICMSVCSFKCVFLVWSKP